MTFRWMSWFLWAGIVTGAAARDEGVDAGEPFGKLPLVAEIDCAAEPPEDGFETYPPGASSVQTLLGRRCRVLPNTGVKPKYFAYRVGFGKGLKAGGCYLLTVEYPEDVSRSFHILNWGCETARGIATGMTVGDILKGRYTNHNAESLQYPLSGKYETWKQMFFLHDRFPKIKRPRGRKERPLTPENGFYVILAQPESKMAPLSAGAAVSRIRLFEVPAPEKFYLPLRPPPEGLPRRHVFFREEMADGVIAMGHKPEEKDPKLRGVAKREDWHEYKAKLMKVLGLNTYCNDLLEFGHNQGWDSSSYGGGSGWYNASSDPQFWNRILTMVGRYDLDVLPYYEYAGSIGQKRELAIGSQRRCRTLKGSQDYTHIAWCHRGNADLADPDFIADARRVLEFTITRHKDKVNFIGAWFRPRPEANPISFNRKNIERFNRETDRPKEVSLADLRGNKKLLQEYYAWWFTKRREFLEALVDDLRANVNRDAFILYTTDASEPGISLPSSLVGKGQSKPWAWKSVVVSDQEAKWKTMLESPRYTEDPRFRFFKTADYAKVVGEDMYHQATLLPRGTWGSYEWQHACPWNDAHNYRESDKALLSYSFNRQYTAASAKGFEAFRSGRGLAIVRHYPLNEHEMNDGKEDTVGYFVSDVERAGPYCMAAEAWAVAHGDPRYIGYLMGNSFNRGYPEYVRNFNAAFLALPALPSTVLKNAATHPKVVVRQIRTRDHGTYLAVVNTGFTPAPNVAISLPATGRVLDCATGKTLADHVADEKLTLSFYPCQLRAVQIK